MLAQDANAQGQQEDQSKRERRLHERERRMLEREDLERPARDREQRRAQPERAAQEVREKRRPKRRLNRGAPRLERLKRIAGVVAAGRAEREREPQRPAAQNDRPFAAAVDRSLPPLLRMTAPSQRRWIAAYRRCSE